MKGINELAAIGMIIGAALGLVFAAAAFFRWIFRINEQIMYLKSIDARLARLAPLPEAHPDKAPAAVGQPAKA